MLWLFSYSSSTSPPYLKSSLPRVLSADDRKPYRLRPCLTREDRLEGDNVVPPLKRRNLSSPRPHSQAHLPSAEPGVVAEAEVVAEARVGVEVP